MCRPVPMGHRAFLRVRTLMNSHSHCLRAGCNRAMRSSSTPSLLVITLLATCTDAWVSTSQSVYGAQIDQIQQQMAGVPSTRFVQAELGGLWTLPVDPLSSTPSEAEHEPAPIRAQAQTRA
eukprot:1960365-Prymnesium_polylepis.1